MSEKICLPTWAIGESAASAGVAGCLSPPPPQDARSTAPSNAASTALPARLRRGSNPPSLRLRMRMILVSVRTIAEVNGSRPHDFAPFSPGGAVATEPGRLERTGPSEGPR